MTRSALVIGCGGTIGGAWTVAALHALAEELQWDPREAAVLAGTSAGAEIVTVLGAGFPVTDLVDMQAGRPVDGRLAAHLADTPPSLPPLPRPVLPSPSALRALGSVRGGHRALAGLAPRGRGDASWLGRLADAVCAPGATWVDHPGVRLIAYRPGDDERVAFTGPAADCSANPALSSAATLSEALRASWAIPGWMPPVVVDGQEHVDGGAASTASVDLVAEHEADVIYVITSMAGLDDVRAPGPGGLVEQALLRKPMSAVLRREIAQVRARGTRVVSISPTSDQLAHLGANFMLRSRREEAFARSLAGARAGVAVALDAAR